MQNLFLLIGFLLGCLFSLVLILYFWSRKKSKFNLILEQEKLKSRDFELKLVGLTQEQKNYNLLKQELEKLNLEKQNLISQKAGLEVKYTSSREFFDQRIRDLEQIQTNMKDAFAQISRENLAKNNELTRESFKHNLDNFIKLQTKERNQSEDSLKKIISPLKDSLVHVDEKINILEKHRQGAYSGLNEQIENLRKNHSLLLKETQVLGRALHAPGIRGRWGEMQLKRVVELSGMSQHVDFVEQKSFSHEGENIRPDMIVTLPQKKNIIIDAKAPLELFYKEENLNNSDSREKELASCLRRHLVNLKRKNYYNLVGQSPEFVVMFLPAENFLARALSSDPLLLDYAAQQEVIIATPLTLIALLKSVSFGFRQEALAQNIEEVRKLAEQLINRVDKVSEHFDKLGKHLNQATESYHQTMRSLDSRVLVTARKLSQIKNFEKPAKSQTEPGLLDSASV